MVHLLKIEWIKLKTYRTFWVIVAAFCFLFIVWNIGASKVTHEMESNPIRLLDESYAFPHVWNTIAYVYRWFIFFFCMFFIISISNEYTFKTQRQHIIDGMHRLQFLHSKVLLLIVVALGGTTFYTITCLFFGLLKGGAQPLSQIKMIPFVFVYTLNYISLASLFALLFKRAGLTIILFFAFLMMESGIGLLINVKIKEGFGNFLPTQCSDELLPLRSWEQLRTMAGDALGDGNYSVLLYLCISLIYIGIYYFVGRRKMLQSDL